VKILVIGSGAREHAVVTALAAGGSGEADGDLVSAGGRVLSVVGVGPDVAAARATAYEGVARIRLRGGHHRTDIAARMPVLPVDA